MYKSQSFRSQKVVLDHVAYSLHACLEEMADTFDETRDSAEVVEEVDDQAEVVNNTTSLCWISLLVLILLDFLKVFIVTPIEFLDQISFMNCMPLPNQVQPLVLAVLSKKMRSLHETKLLALEKGRFWKYLKGNSSHEVSANAMAFSPDFLTKGRT